VVLPYFSNPDNVVCLILVYPGSVSLVL
jgi:hypothetical protein